MGGRKIFVEVGGASDLMPKDGEGSASAYCVIDFDGQRQQTEVQAKCLSPVWNSTLEFELSDPSVMDSQILTVTVLNSKRPVQKRPGFLGRVRITGSSISKQGEEVMVSYKLRRRSLFSQVKGEIGLKVWWMDEPDPPPPEEPAPPAEPAAEAAPPAEAPPDAPAEAPPEAPTEASPAEAPAPEAAAPAEAEKAQECCECESIEAMEKRMMLEWEPVFWDHNLPFSCEVPWNNFIPSSVLENPYINLPAEESWIESH